MVSTHYMSPVGPLTLASDGARLVGLWMDGQKYFGGSIEGPLIEKDDLPLFDQVKGWLDRYFSGKRPSPLQLPLSPIGGAFRQTVWRLLLDIPYGQVTTYGELAGKLALLQNRPSMSSQAVGGAVGHNPISIIIPCHRVVGVNGSLTGYAGGIDKKIQLLEMEGVDTSRFSVPSRGTAL